MEPSSASSRSECSTDTSIHSLLGSQISPWRRAGYVGVGALLVGAPTAAVLVDEQPARAYNLITVTSAADSGPGSLRAALASAVDGDAIDVGALYGSTIFIDSPLQWNTATTIISPSGGVTIDAFSATNGSHVFDVSGAGTHTLSGITVRNADDGAIYCGGENNADIFLTHVDLSYNSQSTVSGAGIAMDGCGNLTLSYYTSINHNYGAGVSMNNSGDFTMSNYTYVRWNYNSTSNGGGIRLVDVHGDVSITGANIENNIAYGSGGGIYLYSVQGSLEIYDSVLADNEAGSTGGGAFLYLDGATSVTISESTVSGNQSSSWGSGLELVAANVPMVLDRLTVDNNHTSDNTRQGAGVFIGNAPAGTAPHVIRNSSFTNNSGAYSGGGLFFYSDVNIYNSTFAGNTSGACAGILGSPANSSNSHLTFVTVSSNSSGVCLSGTTNNMVGTVIAGNMGADINGNGTITGDHNALGPFTSHIDATTYSLTNFLYPQLAALAWNGGPTDTMLPDATSMLIDAGPTTWTPFTGDAFDQRGNGFSRIVGGQSDIGAVERASAPPPSSTTSTSTTSTSTTSTSIAPTTTIDVGPTQPATPSSGRPLSLPPGSAATIDPDGTVTPAPIETTGPGSIAFGSPPLGVEFSGGHVAGGTTIEFAAGGQFTATGRGFQPGSTVSLWIQTPAIRMATVVVDPDGTFTAPVVVPSELPVGDFTIQVQGVGSDGSHRALAVGVSIVSSSALPVTGRDLVGPIGVGSSLLVAGGLGAMAARRARRPIRGHAR